MSMYQGLKLHQELQLKQRLGIELRQELKQVMEQRVDFALKQIATQEFSPFINIEDDDDLELLHESLPFLVLHEVSHVLQQKGKLKVYQPQDIPYLERFNLSNVSDNLNETGIDKSAYTCGIEISNYVEEEMIDSHCALLERVFRDTMRKRKFNPMPEFYARSDAALCFYLEKQLNENTIENIKRLRKEVANYFANNGMQEEAEKLTKKYRAVFELTKLDI